MLQYSGVVYVNQGFQITNIVRTKEQGLASAMTCYIRIFYLPLLQVLSAKPRIDLLSHRVIIRRINKSHLAALVTFEKL